MELVTLRLDELRPYRNNPRYNDEAVDAVVHSIRQVGYISPIVVDENNEILCGHTRFRSLYELGKEEAECVVVRGLSDEQKRKFRLLDNKTAEIAEWDLEKLLKELDGLDFGNFDYFSKEIEKIAGKTVAEHKTEDVVICPKCGFVVSGPVDEVKQDD